MKHTEMVQNKQDGLTPTVDSDIFWMSMHLFYAGSLDEVLQDVIMPTVTELLQENKIDDFFFIRYWEGGPHLRLRLRGTKKNLVELASHVVSSRYEEFLNAHPSTSVEYAVPPDGYYPMDSIQWIAYQPETKRYGGEAALVLAEKLFGASSIAVLHCMRSPHWTHDHAIGAALQFHLSLIHSSGMSIPRMVSFCNWMVTAQLHYASRSLKEYETDPDGAQQRAMLYFKEKYEQQQFKLLPFGRRFWSALQSKSHFDKEWINDWMEAIQPILSELNALGEQGKVEMPFFSGRHDAKHSLTSIHASYIHMTNNRLGIPNSEEPYIAFLLARIIEAISQDHETTDSKMKGEVH